MSPILENVATFFFFRDDRQRLAMGRLLRDCLHLRSPILALGAQLARRLGKFNAVHIRRDDFCRNYPDVVPTSERLLDQLLAHFPSNTSLYIASDEPDRRFFRCIGTRYRVHFLEDLVERNSMPAELLACVEQVVCAYAQAFVGTRLSTFSAYITRLRGYLGAPDQCLRYVDGYWGDAMDAAGSPPFTWVNWRQAGQPLWAREFPEAWSL